MEPVQNYQRTSLFIFILVFLLDLSGHAQVPLVKQWDHKYGGNKFDIHHSFQRTSDGGYSIFGYTESDSTGEVTQLSRGNADYWLVKTDSNGVKQWDSRFGGADIDVGLFHIQTTNNDFLLGGYSISDPGGDKSAARKGYSDFWVIRTTSAGVKLWDRTYGGGAGGIFDEEQRTRTFFGAKYPAFAEFEYPLRRASSPLYRRIQSARPRL